MMHWGECIGTDVPRMRMMHRGWCTGANAPGLMHRGWSTGANAPGVMQQGWCTGGDAPGSHKWVRHAKCTWSSYLMTEHTNVPRRPLLSPFLLLQVGVNCKYIRSQFSQTFVGLLTNSTFHGPLPWENQPEFRPRERERVLFLEL